MNERRRSRWTLAMAAVTALLLGAGCASQRSHGQEEVPHGPLVPLVNVDVYRGVDQSNPTTGRAALNPAQFKFNPHLSTFMQPNQAPQPKPCNYRFTITDVPNNPPQQGDVGNVRGLPNYTAVFDNDPPGHWSIRHPAGVTAQQARQQVSQYAQANRQNVVNGTANNCN